MCNEPYWGSPYTDIVASDEQFDAKGDIIMLVGVGVWESTPANIATNTWTGMSAASDEFVMLNAIVPYDSKGTDNCANGSPAPIVTLWDKAIFRVCPNFATGLADYPATRGLTPQHRTKSIMDASGVDYVGGSDPPFIVTALWSNIGMGNQGGFSSDRGKTWNQFASLPSDIPTYFGGAIAATSPMNFVWSVGACGDPFFTANQGATWTRINLASGVSSHDCGWNSVQGEPAPRQNVIGGKKSGYFYMLYSGSVASAQGVWKSQNGHYWTQAFSGTFRGDGRTTLLRPNPFKAGQFLVTTFITSLKSVQTLWECTDSQPMALVAGSVTCPTLSGTTLQQSYGADYGAPSATNPNQATIGYYGQVGATGGFWTSTNNGKTWQQHGNYGLAKSAIGRGDQHPDRGGRS
jgi:hypothetical protein